MRSGTNSAIMRAKNEKNILSLINRTPMSRVEIAKAIGLTKAAVTIIVDELIEKRLVIEGEPKASMVGRKPLLLSFNGSSLYAIGINIRRNDFLVGMIDYNGNVLLEERFDPCPPETFFKKISGIAESIAERCGVSLDDVRGIGIVTPGPVDLDGGSTLDLPNFSAWSNTAIVERMKEIFGIDIFFTSVSRGITLAEKYFGSAKQSDNFAALLINHDGIGSGVVLNGKLFKGNNEIGHTSIIFDGIECECGNRGCLEKYASLDAVIKGSGHSDWKSVVDSNDSEIIEKEAVYLSTAIINTANVFDIDTVVLCGDVCYGTDKLIEKIRVKTDGKALCRHKLKIVGGSTFYKSLIAASTVVHDLFY